jgi:broad specificity phosphatase PhoE
MTRVILVRHGQTEWNRVQRFRGRVDIELNQTGHRQAQAVAERLSTYEIAALYSSPLQRALQTAQPIAETCGLAARPLEGIVDIDYGAWTGLSPEEAETQNPHLFETWRSAPERAEFPQGESLDDVRRRAWDALNEVCSLHMGECIVLVSHDAVNRVLVCAVLGSDNSPYLKIGQDNGAVNIIETEREQHRLVLLNDTCHLRAL